MVNKYSKKAREYEIVSSDLLNRFCSDLGLSRVEGKQSVVGRVSGTDWEIDAKGITEDGVGFLVVECKRHTTSNLPQAIVASLAYSIQDTGAKGGFIVNPLDLQSGAKKVAAASNIVHVRLRADSTPLEFEMEFLNKLFLGFHDTCSAKITESLAITLTTEDGASLTRIIGDDESRTDRQEKTMKPREQNKPALTPWFPGSLKPVHAGPYERRLQGVTDKYEWDGEQWQTPVGPSVFQDAEWRGLAIKPE